MNKPVHISFTGVDDFTDISKLITLSKRYPIEWGVLIGGDPTKNRYPELQRINEMSSVSSDNDKVNCALHLCGVFANQAKEGLITPEINISGYNRFQVNSIEYDLEQLGRFADHVEKDIIFQHRTGPLPIDLHPRVYALHDQSGGKGKLPTTRPNPTVDKLIGYAGGIGPENVLEVLSQIPPCRFWIDMETKLRIDDKFSLQICEDICKQIWE